MFWEGAKMKELIITLAQLVGLGVIGLLTVIILLCMVAFIWEVLKSAFHNDNDGI